MEQLFFNSKIQAQHRQKIRNSDWGKGWFFLQKNWLIVFNFRMIAGMIFAVFSEKLLLQTLQALAPCSSKNPFSKKLQNSHKKYLCQSLYFNKIAGLKPPIQVFSCKFCEIFQNITRKLFLYLLQKLTDYFLKLL